jgi:hypothetical protein
MKKYRPNFGFFMKAYEGYPLPQRVIKSAIMYIRWLR